MLEISGLTLEQQIAFFYNHPDISGYGTYNLSSYRSIYIEMEVGVHGFIIGATTSGTYNINVNKIDISNKKSNDIADIPFMTDHFIDDYVFVSSILGASYYKMEVTERSFFLLDLKVVMICTRRVWFY